MTPATDQFFIEGGVTAFITTLIATLVLGIAIGYYLGRTKAETKETASQATVVTGEVASQAPTTYTRDAVQPRFRPLPEAAHG